MHYADFAEDEVCHTGCVMPGVDQANEFLQSAALLAAIKEYEASKWKVIGQKVGKPAKVGTDHRPPPASSGLTHLGVRTVCKGAFWRRRIGQDIGTSVALHLPDGGYWISSRGNRLTSLSGVCQCVLPSAFEATSFRSRTNRMASCPTFRMIITFKVSW